MESVKRVWNLVLEKIKQWHSKTKVVNPPCDYLYDHLIEEPPHLSPVDRMNDERGEFEQQQY